jgi:hypothetical protein
MYGKLFEKLILGSVLKFLVSNKLTLIKAINQKWSFGLSQRENKRESDATI